MEDNILENEVISSFEKLIPYLSNFFDDEVSYAITDREKFLRYVPSEHIKLNIKEGSPINPGSSTHECLKSEKTVSKIVSKEVFGFQINSIAVPVRGNDGMIIGTISVGKSLKKQDEILELSKNLSSALQQISTGINQVSSGVQEVAASSKNILLNAEEANTEAKNTDGILQIVKSVADQTNLLGLNAAIEAARAGEAGRGFSIVAQEIRKLSTTSAHSVGQINAILKRIQDSVSSVTVSVNETSNVFQEQASALQEITASIEELNATAQMLEEIASRI